ncbi:MAG: T9SS type A sorting domain-containing protein [Bacteroidetes bacterium]|nr:T9SS type A sorting domain-containing protein [Bacteroidota bacterium]
MNYSKRKISFKIGFSVALILLFTSIKIIAQPLAADAGINQTICSGSSATIGGSPTATFGAGGYTYFWSPSTGLSSTTVANPIASPTTTTTYTLQVTDALLAVATDVVTITVNPLPAVDAILSTSICNGNATSITSFTSTPAGATFNWTNSDPSIGLAASGTGTIPAFTATNTGSTPVVATISVTATLAGCSGPPSIYTITVRPSPVVTPLVSSVVCNGVVRPATNYTSTPSGATFIWSNTNTAIGLGSGGSGNTPSYTSTNTGSTSIGGTISVTATLAGCTGPTINYSATVKPTPVATSTPTTQTRCSGVASNFVLNSTVAGTSYTWTAFGSGVSGHSGGSGTVIAQSVTATTAGPGGVTYTVTPTAAGCVGSNITTNLTVNPIPVATATTSPLTRCSGDTVSFSVSANVPGTTFTWTTFATNVTGADASGTGTYVFDTLTATTAAAGTMVYIFTPVAAGCTGSQAFPFVTVNPYPSATFSYASPACQNTPNIFPLFGPGASAGTFTVSPAGIVINPSTGEIDLTLSTPGGYSITNTIAAAGGCPSTNSNTGFTLNPYVDPTITNVSNVCSNAAPFNLVAASTGGTWSGTGITNSFTGTFDPSIAGIGTHTITYQSSGPCFFLYTDTTVITIADADIYGKVTYSGGDLNSGTNTAVLFNYLSAYTSFDSIQVSSIDAAGYCHFTAIPPGDYLIEVFADTLVYPLAVPTYYDSEYLWDTALVKTHGCTTDTADVYVIEGIVTAGPGMLSGQITEGFGFVRLPGEPIPGIDVKLGKNPGGALVTNTQTDPTGNYAFSNIPINLPGEFYTVYVDIPGLQRDSAYNIIVTATNFVFTQLDYEADSVSVYPLFPLTTSIVSATNENQFTVFPNPTKNNTTIEYTLTKSGFVQLEVFDVLGKKLESPVNTAQQAGKQQINLNNLNPGVYFIKLNINNQSQTTRLVVVD